MLIKLIYRIIKNYIYIYLYILYLIKFNNQNNSKGFLDDGINNSYYCKDSSNNSKQLNNKMINWFVLKWINHINRTYLIFEIYWIDFCEWSLHLCFINRIFIKCLESFLFIIIKSSWQSIYVIFIILFLILFCFFSNLCPLS